MTADIGRKMDDGKGMRKMRRARVRAWIRARNMRTYILHLIINLVINYGITCDLRMKKIVNTPVSSPIIFSDAVLRTRGGPAPRAALYHTLVLLPLPSLTLGRGSVPAKRVSPLWGAGPKLPWPYAVANLNFMNFVIARFV